MEFSNEEIKTLVYALSDRENAMFRDYEAYKKNGNKEAMMDCLGEMKKARELRNRLFDEQVKSDLSDISDEIAKIVREKGEQDGNVYRIWLGGLNGVCDMAGHTDIMCAHLGEDGMLTFQINTPDDKSTIFVYLEELPYPAAIKAINQIKEQTAE